MVYLILGMIALCSGIVGALVGLGGGAILIPATLFVGVTLGYIADLTPQTVVGLSAVMMIFTGLASTTSYFKSGLVDFKAGKVFFYGSVPGTLLGVWVNKDFDLPSFQLYFGILLLILAVLLIVKDGLKPVNWFVSRGKQTIYENDQGEQVLYGYPVWTMLVLAFIIGALSGMFGIGGGAMIVPAFIMLFNIPAHIAVATSMFIVFLTSIVSSVGHMYLGNIPWMYTIPVIVGVYIGAKIGAQFAQKIKSKTLVLLLRSVLIVLGIRSIVASIL